MTRYRLMVILLFSLLAGVSVLSLAGGLPPEIHPLEGMIDSLAAHETLSALIMGQLRLPRFLLALLIGGALGVSGANLQAVMRNPLADPGLLGMTGWASLGAVLVFYTGFLGGTPLVMALAAFAGTLLVALVLFALSYSGIMVMTLAGIALSTVSTALLSLCLTLVPSPYARFEMTHWLLGSLNQVEGEDVLIAAPGLTGGIALLLLTGRGLDGLSLGEEVASSMGIRPYVTYCLIIGGCALSLGSAVAVAGNIAFIGLVVPHITRFLVGYKPSDSLLPSVLCGALLLVCADGLVRLLGGALPLGVVTTLIGTPFFLFQIIRLHQRHVV